MFFFLIVVLTILLSKVNNLSVKIKVAQGIVIGKREATVFDEKIYYAFYGVPYAHAPVGKLRFKDPKPIKKWKKPFDGSTEYRGACAQAHIVHKQGLYGFENCLHLNIYTPILNHKKENLKPVIVFIHGYAFTSSFSHIYGPDFLIDNDIVVVTLTHRLGAFGFLKINSTDFNANMGLKDIVMALKWIKKNIVHFGGDKERITVMGSGSAATFLSILLMTKYKIIFSKMILQSGSIFSPSLFQGDIVVEREKLIKEIKKSGFSDLKSAPTDIIVQKSRKIYNSKDVTNFQRPVVPFLPTIENDSNKSLVTSTVNTFNKFIQNHQLKIPILIGFASQESIGEVIPFIHNPHYMRAFQTFFKFMVPFTNKCKYKYTTKTYKDIANMIRSRYFKNGISENSIDDFLKFSSDLYKYPMYKFINSIITSGDELFVYKFNYIGKLNVAKATSLGNSNLKIKGAAQGDEICYILKCEPMWETYVKLKNQTNNPDRIFIKQISRMWANFAKLGAPTYSNGFDVNWQPMSLKEDTVFLFDKVNKLVTARPEKKMFKFWNDIFHKYYAPEQCNIHDEL